MKVRYIKKQSACRPASSQICPYQRVVEFTALNRRDFIRLSAAASAAVVYPTLTFAEANPAASVRLTLGPDRLGNKIGDDFTGLSYESAQLGNPHFFSGDNTDLAGFMRRLGTSGVLRI